MSEEVKDQEGQAEEAKTCAPDTCDDKNPVKIALKMLIGILLLITGAVLIAVWFGSLLTVFKGCFGVLLILAGLITFAIAKE